MSGPSSPGPEGDPDTTLLHDAGRAGPLDREVAIGLLQRGQALADQGDWDIAVGTFARVVGTDDPTMHTAALLGLAECRYRLDQEPAALQAWISATQAPENGLTWRAWKALAAARVRQGDMPGAARAYREAARRAPASEQPELQSRIGWLSKEVGDQRGAQRAFGRSRANGPAQPVVTWALLAVTLTVGILTLVGGQEDLEAWLQLDKFSVYLDGQYWRLLSVVLVHGTILHLMFNMYALWAIGPIVELLYGPLRYLAIYVLCGVAGSAASYVTSPNPTVGASGAIFGLFGVLLVADRVHKPALTRNARSLSAQVGVLIGINLLFGVMTPGIDNAAHIGGLLAGAWLGFALVPRGARLASFWSRPAATGAPIAGAADPGRRALVLRQVGGVAALIGVVVLVMVMGPITWHPRDYGVGRAEPGATAEAVDDAVGITAPVAVGPHDTDVRRLRGGWTVALGALPGDVHGQVHLQGSARRPPGTLVTEEQAPPGGHRLRRA